MIEKKKLVVFLIEAHRKFHLCAPNRFFVAPGESLNGLSGENSVFVDDRAWKYHHAPRATTAIPTAAPVRTFQSVSGWSEKR